MRCAATGTIASEHVRHEKAVAFAADVAITGELAVELSLPPAISVDQVKGFTLDATRSVLSGRDDELIDLVKTDVTRRLYLWARNAALASAVAPSRVR